MNYDCDIYIIVAQNTKNQDFKKLFTGVFEKNRNFKALQSPLNPDLKGQFPSSLIVLWAKINLLTQQLIKNIDFEDPLENFRALEIVGIKFLIINVNFKNVDNNKIKQEFEKLRELSKKNIG